MANNTAISAGDEMYMVFNGRDYEVFFYRMPVKSDVYHRGLAYRSGIEEDVKQNTDRIDVFKTMTGIKGILCKCVSYAADVLSCRIRRLWETIRLHYPKIYGG